MEKRIKRFLSLALALIMVIGLVPMGIASAEEETDANPNVNYRWEIGTDDDGNPALVNVTGGIYTENEFTKTSGTVASTGALSSLKGSFATPITLLPTEEWVVEWKVTNWKTASTAFLSDANGFGTSYIYHNTSNVLAVGRSSSGYWNLGFKTSDSATYIDMTAEHVFRLENRLNDDDTNSVWMVLDGADFFEMNTQCYKGSTFQQTFTDWLTGATLNFGYIVGISCDELEYLAVYENGTDCSHNYGEWTVSADGKKLERACAYCGETESKDYYGYRWVMNGETLESVVSGENLSNDLTLKAGNTTGGKLSGYSGQMTSPVTLLPTNEWVIEWKSSGEWTGMLLASHQNGTTNSVYLYQHSPYSKGLLSFGTKGSEYFNTGVDISAIDQNTEHTFRIENRIDEDGVAMAYLMVDGVEIGAMNNYRTGSGTSTSTSTAIYNLEEGLTFNYVGGDVYKPSGMNLEYLQIWPNGTTHKHAYTASEEAGANCQTGGKTVYTCSCGDTYSVDNEMVGGHVYGDWYLSEDGTQLCRECKLCDASETEAYKAYMWQMSEDDTLDNIVEGIFAENELTISTGEITDGVLSKVKGTFAENIVLESTKEWVIEWKSSGAWNTFNSSYGGVFLANGTSAFMYYNAKYVFALGHHYSGSTYHNYGFVTTHDDTYIDMSAEHVFRLENRLNDDGTNSVWLVLDGEDFFEMNSQGFTGSSPSELDDWLNGTTLTFTGIGNTLAGVNDMDLEYLKIYLNTPGCEHSYGAWTSNSDGDIEHTCENCGKTEAAVAVFYDYGNENYSYYVDLSEAITAANATDGIDDVVLLTDVTVDSITLMANTMLDLHGHTLTVTGSLMALTDSVVYDFEGSGLLKIAQDKLMVHAENGYLPVWNGTDGYVFAGCSDSNTKSDVDYDAYTAVYYFQPVITGSNALEAIKLGNDISGLKICVTVSWTVGGVEGSKTFYCNDELVNDYLAGYNSETGSYKYAFKLSLTGVENVDEGSLSFSSSVIANGVTVECD